MTLDDFNNNKSTPTKKTGFHDDMSMDSETSKPATNENLEIHTPSPADATNDIPIEIPERGAHQNK